MVFDDEKCTQCGSGNIIYGMVLEKTFENYTVGFKYNIGLMRLSIEPVVCDFCEDCGLILRSYIRETNRKWFRDVHKK